MFLKLLSGLNFLAAETGWIKSTTTTVNNIVNAIVWPIFSIIAAVGIIYAIILGINYAKAETSDKREEAKKRIINAVVGVVIMLALIIVIKVFIANEENIKLWVERANSGSWTETTT